MFKYVFNTKNILRDQGIKLRHIKWHFTHLKQLKVKKIFLFHLHLSSWVRWNMKRPLKQHAQHKLDDLWNIQIPVLSFVTLGPEHRPLTTNVMFFFLLEWIEFLSAYTSSENSWHFEHTFLYLFVVLGRWMEQNGSLAPPEEHHLQKVSTTPRGIWYACILQLHQHDLNLTGSWKTWDSSHLAQVLNWAKPKPSHPPPTIPKQSIFQKIKARCY